MTNMSHKSMRKVPSQNKVPRRPGSQVQFMVGARRNSPPGDRRFERKGTKKNAIRKVRKLGGKGR